MIIEKALRRCVCPLCGDKIYNGDYRIPHNQKFFHLKCYKKIALSYIKQWTKDFEKTETKDYKKKMKEEHDKIVMRAI